jgi:hypothetical protein
MLDFTDYELVWPPELFAAEARRLLAWPRLDRAAIDLLLREAFHEGSVVDDLSSLDSADPWGSGPPGPGPRQVLSELAASVSRIPRRSSPRPYWPQRHGSNEPGLHLDARAVRRAFADLVDGLERNGYLEHGFPRPCVDDQDGPEPDPRAELERRLGIGDLWPLAPDGWDDSTFYGLIEVYHDLVSRPSERHYHDYGRCGWHYSHFSVKAGRQVYRWRANELLQAAGITYRLADSGEDEGRLVAIFGDGRSALLAQAVSTAQPTSVSRIDHAIAMFRKRGANAEDKRSALLTLAGILEERRQLIKAELGTADEGALFKIANKFAVRHQNKQQFSNYDVAFLDWLFWWYLGTVDLTNRIISRQEGKGV